jgi:hypothetical protein
MTIRPLVPGFLKKLDDYLLLNKPAAWSARTHLALWYSVLFGAVLMAICFAVPFDARQNSNVSSWVIFISVIILLSLIVWLIYLLRFNVFKKSGQLPRAYGISTFFLYFIVVGSFIAWAYIPAVVESIRANNAYSNEEIVADANTVNLDLCRLERDSLLLEWGRDTCIFRKNVAYIKTAKEKEKEAESVNLNENPDAQNTTVEQDSVVVAPIASESNITYYGYKERNLLDERVRGADSMERPSDSVYIMVSCPDYNFLSDFGTDEYSKVKTLKSVDLYNKVLKHYHSPNRRAVRRGLDSLLKKYNTDPFLIEFVYPEHYKFNRSEYMNHTQSKYNTYEFNRSMFRITEKKYRWKSDVLQDFVRPFYYIVMTLVLLVFIFRHTTIRTFFLSMLVAVILLILTSLFFVFMQFHSDAAGYMALLFYFVLFGILMATIRRNGVRHAWRGIALNLWVFFICVMPLVAAAWYNTYLREKYQSYQYPDKFENMNLYLLLAEGGGFILLLVLLDTVIVPMYKRWFALPEQ